MPTLSDHRTSCLRLLKKKGFKEERLTKVGLYAIGKSTTLESKKSLPPKGLMLALPTLPQVGVNVP